MAVLGNRFALFPPESGVIFCVIRLHGFPLVGGAGTLNMNAVGIPVHNTPGTLHQVDTAVGTRVVAVIHHGNGAAELGLNQDGVHIAGFKGEVTARVALGQFLPGVRGQPHSGAAHGNQV
ncbi:MAG: hypothetical protein BWX80_03915 [Candidatus Hydrogenedentes bacterium ADurb.Bin101]|nr:MAG: hypothetical protein BWX80_03915 [Candidatus Hydrogenedentes bacterium ADurb.Bin101]